ncbi:MAG: alpha-L-fucosidase [Planctomycetota bacterium]
MLTELSPTAALWFDFTFVRDVDRARDNFLFNKGREAWDSPELYNMIRELQKQVLLTDRLDLDMHLSGGDFVTPEQAQPWRWVHSDDKPATWEACQTLSGSWGYFRDEHDWRSTKQLITTLIDCVSKGGNLLLNVGPNGRGEIDQRALDRLSGIGRWMRLHNRSIYGCTQAPDVFTCPTDCRLTYNPQRNRLYLHLLNLPYKFVHLQSSAYAQRVEYAQLLHDASECQGLDDWHADQLKLPEDTLTLTLPQREPDGIDVPVIELFLRD